MKQTLIAAVVATFLIGCSESQIDLGATSIHGKVSLGSIPLKMGTIYVESADGQQANGPIDADGTYVIFNPPVGSLRYRLVTIPPPPLGSPAVPPIPGMVAIPSKYSKYADDRKIEYTGGRQEFNVEMTK